MRFSKCDLGRKEKAKRGRSMKDEEGGREDYGK
jgi:hypothetical protein